jgi:hypothetical protein
VHEAGGLPSIASCTKTGESASASIGVAKDVLQAKGVRSLNAFDFLVRVLRSGIEAAYGFYDGVDFVVAKAGVHGQGENFVGGAFADGEVAELVAE